MSVCGSVFTPRIICPPDQRTFNSDGTRVSEVGLKEWDEGGLKEGEDGKGVGRKSVVGQMKNPTHGFGEKSAGDETSLKSGFSGDTVGGEEKKGERRGSLVKRLFGRKGSEEKRKE